MIHLFAKYEDYWIEFSNGEKDLWKWAWILTKSKFHLIPYVTIVGDGYESKQFQMSSQIKNNFEGNHIGIHQLSRYTSRNLLPITPCLSDLFGIKQGSDWRAGYNFHRKQNV